MEAYKTNADMVKEIIKVCLEHNLDLNHKLKCFLEQYSGLFSDKRPVTTSIINALKYLFDELDLPYFSNKDLSFLLLNNPRHSIYKASNGDVYLDRYIKQIKLDSDMFVNLKADKSYLISNLILVAKYTKQL